MSVAAVVVTRNQHDILRQCLASLETAMERVEGEIVVVDNASTDDTPRVLATEFPRIRVIRNAVNLHYTRAVNQGTRATESDYVYLLNDDTVLPADMLKTLEDFMEAHPKCGVVGPEFVTPQGAWQVSAQMHPSVLREVSQITGVAWRLRNARCRTPFVTQYPTPMSTMQVDWVCGGALFARRTAMESLGLHDENYLFYRDDPDIGRRMRDAGWEVWYCAETKIAHHHGLSTVKTPSKVRFELIAVRSRRHFHRKFHGALGAAVVELADGAMSLLRSLGAVLTGRTADAARHWGHLRVLFTACRLPEEEREAIEGYRSAEFNGRSRESKTLAAAMSRGD